MRFPRNPQHAAFLRELGFYEDPFSNYPDPRFFCPTSQHGFIQESLMDMVDRALGFAVVEGAEGYGKSIIARRLDSYYDCRTSDFRVVYFPNPLAHIDSDFKLLSLVSDALGLAPRRGVLSQLTSLSEDIKEKYIEHIETVIIVDAGEDLGKEALNQLIRLGQDICPVILFGTKGLVENLGQTNITKASYRISLSPFSLIDASEMIQYRCTVAKHPSRVFSLDAVNYLWMVTEGSPRKLIELCSAVLNSVKDSSVFPIPMEMVQPIALEVSSLPDISKYSAVDEEGEIDKTSTSSSSESADNDRSLSSIKS